MLGTGWFIRLVGSSLFVVMSASSCAWGYEGTTGNSNPCQDQLTSFIQRAVENRALTWSQVQEMLTTEFVSTAEGGVKERMTRQFFLSLLNQNPQSRGALLSWVKAQMGGAHAQQVEIEKVSTKTTLSGYRMRFQPLASDLFYAVSMGTEAQGKKLEMMDTAVTQGMWQQVMGGRFASSPDRPVTNIEVQDLLEFLETLNHWAKKKDPRIMELLPDTKRTDHFRLPTPQEMGVIFHFFIRSENIEMFSPERLLEHAWMQENSGGTVQPVATLQPVYMHDGQFFDLFGNIQILVQLHLSETDGELRWGTWGGSVTTPVQVLASQDGRFNLLLQRGRMTSTDFNSVGIRLVRQRRQ